MTLEDPILKESYGYKNSAIDYFQGAINVTADMPKTGPKKSAKAPKKAKKAKK